MKNKRNTGLRAGICRETQSTRGQTLLELLSAFLIFLALAAIFYTSRSPILNFRFFIVFRSYCVVIFSTKIVPVLLPAGQYLTKIAIKSGNTLGG